MMDGNFVDKIVHEVKSQGVFDEFRKDSLADVDTKPAYQNLRGRVESAVKSFLSDQKWTPETNKIQLREKLRKHIADLGFLDIGVERIVDQVVGPKIRTIYQPKIELIAYKYLGITPPEPPIGAPPPVPQMLEPPPLPPLGHLNGSMLTVETTSSLLPTDLEQISPDSDKATVKSDIKEESKDDDLPPGVDGDETPFDDDISPPFEPVIKLESLQSQVKVDNPIDLDVKNIEKKDVDLVKSEPVVTDKAYKNTVESINATEPIKVDVNASLDAGASQESQLSQISSDSRLTAASGVSTADPEQSKEDLLTPTSAANMSEEAQMPNFNDNSCEAGIRNSGSELHFDIKKDTITFEGTERHGSMPEVVEKSNGINQLAIEDAIMSEVQKNLSDQNNTAMGEQKKKMPPIPAAHESSFGSCGDDTQNSIIQKTPKDEDVQKIFCDSKETVPIIESGQQKPDCETELPLPENSKDDLMKPSTPSSSTSSSRYKRHSKEKHHSSDNKHRHRSRSAHRDGSRGKSHSRNKHYSSSSSKHSLHKSSHHDKSTSTQSSSASSSRSSTAHDSSSKHRDRRDSDRKYKSSSSKSDRKEHSSSSSTSKKSDRDRHKSSSTHDDHNESRIKSQRRRSNDSNDEGKKANGKPTSTPMQTSHNTSMSPKSKGKSNTEEPNGNGTNGYKSANDQNANISKVIFLNEILEHPSTDYIELTSSGGKVIKSGSDNNDSKVMIDQPPSSLKSTTSENTNDSQDESVSNSSLDNELLYFEENNSEFSTRLSLLESIISGCRTIVNNLKKPKDSCDEEDGNQRVLHTAVPKRMRLSESEHITCENSTEARPFAGSSKIRQRIDAIINVRSHTEEHEPETKRIKCNESKTSPAPSDASSANSKENESLEKYETDADGNQLRAKLAGASFSKLCQQQRYTNDDLYKPRPVLSQRSRRRHLDSIP